MSAICILIDIQLFMTSVGLLYSFSYQYRVIIYNNELVSSSSSSSRFDENDLIAMPPLLPAIAIMSAIE